VAEGEGLVTTDITVAGGRIAALGPGAAGLPRFELDDGMVFPAFVDMHVHLDKGHIWPRRPNPDGTFEAALAAVGEDRAANWTAEDIARRMDFALRSAHAHGTALMRTHIDSVPPHHLISWPVLAEMRERWAGRIELQAAPLFPATMILDDGFAAELTASVRAGGGIMGAVTYMDPDLDAALERLFRIALDEGVPLDFHVDESADPGARSLRHVAETAIRMRFADRIVAGHCCSLSLQPAEEAERTLDRVAEAGIAVVSLPMCNMYLQDRHAGRTPRWRGVTLLHEMRARGIPVSVASDNTRDPFYAYGDLDMVEVFREAARILHLDHPFGAWPAVATATPAAVLGRPERGRIAVGGPADLVLFRARSWTELLSRPQADRTVLRAGRAIDRTLPDYRELDDLFPGPGR
jgi:cytosine deaminase